MPRVPRVRSTEAERVERGDDLVFHDATNRFTLPDGLEHAERPRRATAPRNCVPTVPEATFDRHHVLADTVRDALLLRACPLRRSPREVGPAEARVVHLVAHDRSEDRLRDRITRALVMRGMNAITAKQQALAILDRQLQAQASVLAFSRLYLLSGIALMTSLPLLLLFRSGKSRGLGPGAAH